MSFLMVLEASVESFGCLKTASTKVFNLVEIERKDHSFEVAPRTAMYLMVMSGALRLYTHSGVQQ